MSFRDLKLCNLAFLFKQVGRLISDSDSIVALLYKAKYFRRGDLLPAPLGYRPSSVWRSIHLVAAKALHVLSLTQIARCICENILRMGW